MSNEPTSQLGECRYFAKVCDDIGFDPPTPGKTKPDFGCLLTSRASSSRAFMYGVIGTLCARPFFISEAGIVSTSSSSHDHFSFAVSPGRSIEQSDHRNRT